MQIFISWSGAVSKAIAEALQVWLRNVIQVTDPWFSSQDISKGTRWSVDIAARLEASTLGIICLTPENLAAPWILFEAGALSKSVRHSHVCPLLYQVDPADIVGPLSQFQATRIEKSDMRKLIHTVNRALGEKSLTEAQVNSSFEIWWPHFESKISDIALSSTVSVIKQQRSERDLIEEVLTLVRSLGTDMYRMQSILAGLGLYYGTIRSPSRLDANPNIQLLRPDQELIESLAREVVLKGHIPQEEHPILSQLFQTWIEGLRFPKDLMSSLSDLEVNKTGLQEENTETPKEKETDTPE